MSLCVFLFIATNVIITVIMSVCSKNPVYGIVFLIISFCNSACLLVMLELEYIPLMLLIVYVGAIAVLFLFVIMLLNIRTTYLKGNNTSHTLLVLSFVSLAFFAIMYLPVSSTLPVSQTALSVFANNCLKSALEPFVSNTVNVNLKIIGSFLFTEYCLVFIILSFVLLLAMVAAIILTLEKQLQAKTQKAPVQILEITPSF